MDIILFVLYFFKGSQKVEWAYIFPYLLNLMSQLRIVKANQLMPCIIPLELSYPVNSHSIELVVIVFVFVS